MDRWEIVLAVSKMQEHIEANLNNVITLSDLADVAGYSQWHSARIFKELTGKTPFAYIRSLRLSKAAVVLSKEKTKVVDVAFDFVFASHEGFTRAFHKQFGIPPKKVKDNAKSMNLFMPHRVRDYYLSIQKGEKKMTKEERVKPVFVQVVKRPARKLILKRAIKATHYFEYCDEVGDAVWETLSQIKEAMFEPAGMWLPQSLIKPGTSMYVQGVEVPLDYNSSIPEGFDIIELEPCTMMIFQGEPYDDEKFHEAIEEIWGVINKYNPELYGFAWADDQAPRFQLEPQGYRGYIEGRPVIELKKQ